MNKINLELEQNPSCKNELNVKFVVAIPDPSIQDNEAYIIYTVGRDNDLLWSQYASDVGLILPEGILAGVYLCTNLRVTNQYQSANPENPEIDYDLECDWEAITNYYEI